MHFPMHLPHMYLPLHGCMHIFLLRKTWKRCTIKMVGFTLNLKWHTFKDKFQTLEWHTFQDGGSTLNEFHWKPGGGDDRIALAWSLWAVFVSSGLIFISVIHVYANYIIYLSINKWGDRDQTISFLQLPCLYQKIYPKNRYIEYLDICMEY